MTTIDFYFDPKQSGSLHWLIERLEFRRSNILVSLGFHKESQRHSTADPYIAGELTGPERDKWRRIITTQALQLSDDYYYSKFDHFNAVAVDDALDGDLSRDIRYFSDQNLFPKSDIEYSRAIFSILHKLTWVQSLKLSMKTIHSTFMEECTQALHQMRELRKLELSIDVEIPNIQLWIGSWPQLQEFSVSSFGWALALVYIYLWTHIA